MMNIILESGAQLAGEMPGTPICACCGKNPMRLFRRSVTSVRVGWFEDLSIGR